MIEQWRDIKGYEGLYQVSDHGNVRSCPRKVWNYTKPGRLMKFYAKSNGYLTLALVNKDGTCAKHIYVHRLVAEAFVPNPSGYTQINHKDFNKANNHYLNLEWVTPKMNIVHFRESRMARKHDDKKQRTLANKSLNYILENKESVLCLYDSGASITDVSSNLKIGRDRVRDILIIYGRV